MRGTNDTWNYGERESDREGEKERKEAEREKQESAVMNTPTKQEPLRKLDTPKSKSSFFCLKFQFPEVLKNKGLTDSHPVSRRAKLQYSSAQ